MVDDYRELDVYTKERAQQKAGPQREQFRTLFHELQRVRVEPLIKTHAFQAWCEKSAEGHKIGLRLFDPKLAQIQHIVRNVVGGTALKRIKLFRPSTGTSVVD